MYLSPLTSKWSVVRPKGPAVLPARVEGPGGCHPHPVRPNGPTVPRTARASRGTVGPLGRYLSWSVLPGPLGRAGRTAGPLGRQTPAASPPRATTHPGRGPRGSPGVERSDHARSTPPQDANTPQVVPESVDQQDQRGRFSPTGPPTVVCGCVREAPKQSPARRVASRRAG
jgi:hypothetical protein